MDLFYTAFSKSYNAIHEGVPNIGLPSSNVEWDVRLRDLANETYAFQKDRVLKLPVQGQQQSTASPQQQTTPGPAQQSSVNAPLVGSFPTPDPLQPKSMAYTDLTASLKNIISLEEQNRWATLIASSREAKSRVIWTGAIGLQIVITVAAIAGAIWVIVTSVEEQSAARSPGAAVGVSAPPSHLRQLGKFAIVMTVATVIAYVVFEFFYGLAFSEYVVAPPKWPIIPSFNDNFSKYINEYIMPGVSGLIGVANILLGIGGIILIVAVSATLLQRPTDKTDRTKPPPAAGTNDVYQEFLTRCFERLKITVYIGAILLIVCVAQINAWYAWPASLIPFAAETEPLGQLSKALNETSGQLSLEYGLAFTLVLIAMYLPALVILRRRAWQLARARNPGTNIEANQKWLVERNLALSVPQTVMQSIILLSPAALGTVLHFFDFLSPK